MSECYESFLFGKPYIILFDVSERRQGALLESEFISFIHVNWKKSNRINLSDEQGNPWSCDLVNSKLERAP